MVTSRAGSKVRASKSLPADFPLTPTGWPFRDPYDFMSGKRVDDQVSPELHRVHDKLYDLQGFKHPGGDEWLSLTVGTDITELFETHHLNYAKATAILAKFEVPTKEPLPPRQSLLTFHENDFYAQLRAKVFQQLPQVTQVGSSSEAKRFADALVIISVLLTFWTGHLMMSSNYNAILAGLTLGALNGFFIGIGHNFLHQKFSFRRYYLDISGLSSAEFRMHHALSHHPYTNTPLDAEINGLLPDVNFFPHQKSSGEKVKTVLALTIICTFGILIREVPRLFKTIRGKWHGNSLDKFITLFIPFIQILLLSNLSVHNVKAGLMLWLMMRVATSSVFLWGNFLNGPHFNDECWHHGDTLDSTDWGILQVQTNVERSDLSSRDVWWVNLLALPTFNLHHLHHLFPTIDATYLTKLVPIFEVHCLEYKVQFKTMSNKSLAKGLWRCIVTAYEKPNERTRNGIYDDNSQVLQTGAPVLKRKSRKVD